MMNKLVEELLSIEQAANADLAELEGERAVQARQTETEIARRLQEVEASTALTLEAIKREAEVSLTAELTAIDVEYRAKTAELKQLFEENTPMWRQEVTQSIQSQP